MKENTIRSCLLLTIDTEIREAKSKRSQMKINSETSSQLSRQYASPSISFINPLICNASTNTSFLIKMTNKTIFKSQTLKHKVKKKASSHHLNLLYLKGKNDMRKKNISFKTKKNSKLFYLSPFEVISFKTETKNESIGYLNALAKEIHVKNKKENDTESFDEDDEMDFVYVKEEDCDAFFKSKNRKEYKSHDNEILSNSVKKKRKRLGSYEPYLSRGKGKHFKNNRMNSLNDTLSESGSNKEEFNVKLYSMNCDTEEEE